MGVDAIVHVVGLLLTILGTVYTSYPALRGRQRAPITRGLVVGLAGGLVLAAVVAVLTLIVLLYALASGVGRGPAARTVVAAYVAIVAASFSWGAVVGLLAGLASAVERPGGPAWRRNAVLAAAWFAILTSAVLAAGFWHISIGPFIFALVAWSLVAGVLVEPPALDRRQRATLVVVLPAGYLILAATTRLASQAGIVTRDLVGIVAGTLETLAVTAFFIVLAFVLCRPPRSLVRRASVRRFLANAALGLAVAAGPGLLNMLLIHGSPNLAYLAFGIAPLVTALDGEARLFLHTPRARIVAAGHRRRLAPDVARLRFRGGVVAGATFAMQAAVVTIVVIALVPSLPPVAPLAQGVATVVFVASWALALGMLNVAFPLLVANVERLPAERFIVPGIVMIVAGTVLLDSDALLRAAGL